MKNNNNNFNADILLREAMYSTESPDAALVRQVKNMEYQTFGRRGASRAGKTPSTPFRRPIGMVAAIAAVIILSTGGAFAAWFFLSPGDVADKAGDYALSAAFDSDTAININESVTSKGYTFTLLAVVTGKDITDMPYYREDVLMDRTYAVVAIQNEDGTPMPDAQDDAYGKTPFFASPLVKGTEPWRVNAATMNGGYCEIVADGVLYRLVECDSVAAFADRGLYFVICESMFIDRDTFLYNAQSGEIAVNPDYDGASAVFGLPLDKSLSDPAKAEQYLNSLYAPEDEANDIPAPDFSGIDWTKAIPVASTAKTLKADANGKIIYTYDFEYGSGQITTTFDDCFTNEPAAQSIVINITESKSPDGTYLYGVRFSKDENGIITGEIVLPE